MTLRRQAKKKTSRNRTAEVGLPSRDNPRSPNGDLAQTLVVQRTATNREIDATAAAEVQDIAAGEISTGVERSVPDMLAGEADPSRPGQ